MIGQEIHRLEDSLPKHYFQKLEKKVASPKIVTKENKLWRNIWDNFRKSHRYIFVNGVLIETSDIKLKDVLSIMDERFISNKAKRKYKLFIPQNLLHPLLIDEDDVTIVSEDKTRSTGNFGTTTIWKN